MRCASLRGKTVVVTRPRGQAEGLARGLARAGARVIEAPTIKIAPPSSYRPLDKALRRLADYDAVVFTSVNAVERFFARARTLRLRLKAPRVYAIGPKTAARLREFGWRPSAIPRTSRGESLARVVDDPRGKLILLPRAQKAREALAALLRRRGARVDAVEAYRTLANASSSRRLKRLARADVIDAVTFTSASTVDQFVRQVEPARCRRLFRRAAAASIGPITSTALKAHGIAPSVQARHANEESLLAGLARYFERSRA